MTAGSPGTGEGGSGRRDRVVNIAILGTLAILLLNPSGIVGSRIIAGYKGWQEERRVSRNWTELASAPSYLGPPPVLDRGVIVEFVAYDCLACQTVAPAVLEATRSQGVTVVVRHVPSERGGPASREAALAAICAERHGLFPEAHDALISDETWRNTRDWVGLGVSLGVGDPASFGTCLGEEATQSRLARDVELADILQILGTPTFVSAEALHLGAPGLASALAAATSPTQHRTPRRLATESVFDSSEYPGLSDQLLEVTAGFFTPDTGLILVDLTEIHIVDMSSNENRVLGREGEGPGEFGRITGAFRTSEGIAVWDILRRRVVSITHDGEFGHSQGYLDVPFKSFAKVRPVARQSDGSIVFRDGNGSVKVQESEGRYWSRTRYVAVGRDGGLQVVAEAQGSEMYSGTRMNDPVVFGHRTFEAATVDRLIVAETDREAITVLDWSGRRVTRIPMPAGVSPTPDEVRMAREFEASRVQETKAWLMEATLEGRTPFSTSPEVWADFPTLPSDWPANEVAPPIDAMLTDFDGRLWVRDYPLPGQDSVTWRVWDIDRERMLFTTRMAGEDTLLDARGDLVLLHRLDAFDAPRAVVAPLRPALVEGGTFHGEGG